MRDATIRFIVDYVEGRASDAQLQRRLARDPKLEATLNDDPDLRRDTYVGPSTFLFLLETDFRDPGGALNAQGALEQWLERHAIPCRADKSRGQTFNLLLNAQPRWLNVDGRYLQEQFVARAGKRKGKELVAWLRKELLAKFRFVAKPPRWLQGPEWPIGKKGPLVFLGQVDINKPYFHDVASVYVFHDPATGDCTTVVQVA